MPYLYEKGNRGVTCTILCSWDQSQLILYVVDGSGPSPANGRSSLTYTECAKKNCLWKALEKKGKGHPNLKRNKYQNACARPYDPSVHTVGTPSFRGHKKDGEARSEPAR